MRTIIAGSRYCTNMDHLENALDCVGWGIDTVISGGAPGVDQLAKWWAERAGIPFEVYTAQWGKYGKSAGPRRNEQMAENAHALIALWDGKSRGTKHMIDIALKKGLVVLVWNFQVSQPSVRKTGKNRG